MSYSGVYARLYGLVEEFRRAVAEIFSFQASFIYLTLFIFWQAVVWTQSILIKKSLSSDIVILHYNIDFGIDLVAASGKIYLYPLLAFFIFFVNLILLMFLYRNKNLKILIHYLLAAAVLFNFLLSLVLLSVYLINFR